MIKDRHREGFLSSCDERQATLGGILPCACSLWNGQTYSGRTSKAGGLPVGIIYNQIIPKQSLTEDIHDFRGLTASTGKAIGTARLIQTVKEIHKIRRGDILVAIMTRPDYAPAMKLASAIVTNEGGITSHAAIVARELGIPCVIGTKIATEVLHDGDLIEVNANHGVVKILKRARSA